MPEKHIIDVTREHIQLAAPNSDSHNPMSLAIKKFILREYRLETRVEILSREGLAFIYRNGRDRSCQFWLSKEEAEWLWSWRARKRASPTTVIIEELPPWFLNPEGAI